MESDASGENVNLTSRDKKLLRSYLSGYGPYRLLSDESIEIRDWIQSVLGSRQRPEVERMGEYVDFMHRLVLDRPDICAVFLEAGMKDELTREAISCLVPFLSVSMDPGMTIEDFLIATEESSNLVVEATAKYWSCPEVRDSFPTLHDCVLDALKPFYSKYPYLQHVEKYVMRNGLAIVRRLNARLRCP